MAAFIPNRRKPEVTSVALAKVREDKEREAGLASTARGSRTRTSYPSRCRSSTPCSAAGSTSGTCCRRDRGRQLASLAPPCRRREHVTWTGLRAQRLRRTSLPDRLARRARCRGGQRPHGGRRDGRGAGRQVWQWVHHRVVLSGGAGLEETVVTPDLVQALLDDTTDVLNQDPAYEPSRLAEAREIFEQVSLGDDFPTFLTLPAYDLLP